MVQIFIVSQSEDFQSTLYNHVSQWPHISLGTVSVLLKTTHCRSQIEQLCK